eukprot:gene40132-63967_t
MHLIEFIGTNYSDLTGKMTKTSKHGSNYLLISVFNNYVHYEPMKTRNASDYIQAFKNTFTFFKLHGLMPKLQVLDNETSNNLEAYFKSENIEFQFVPPKVHRTNRAERAIRDAKNHLISGLSTAHPDCPNYLWEDFLPQAELTLNMLRPSGSNPHLSAYFQLYKTNYDFLAHPISPPG